MQGGKRTTSPSRPLRGLPLATTAGLAAIGLAFCYLGVALHSWPLLVLYSVMGGILLILLDSRLRAKKLWTQASIGAIAANRVAWLAWWLWPVR